MSVVRAIVIARMRNRESLELLVGCFLAFFFGVCMGVKLFLLLIAPFVRV